MTAGLFECVMSQPINLGDSLPVALVAIAALVGVVVGVGICAAWSQG